LRHRIVPAAQEMRQFWIGSTDGALRKLNELIKAPSLMAALLTM
jgi:hypothetical protein